jgi:tetratricopeptide (TPR) repeat protein
MRRYSAREAAALLGLPASRVRAFVRAGFLEPERGPRGALRFSFQDLVLLRTAKGLADADVPARRVRLALRRLRAQLPVDRPLTGVHISAEGRRIVVRDGGATWQPESGQVLFDFGVEEIARGVHPLRERRGRKQDSAQPPSADDWYECGCELEPVGAEEAVAAYRRALELDPEHADACLNLGRLLHEGGDVAAAEALYGRARTARPEDPTAAFNHGVALEDLGRGREAIAAYERAVALDAHHADAHYNLARLHEQAGQRAAALRHLRAYKKLADR